MRVPILAAFAFLAGCVNVDVELGARRGHYTGEVRSKATPTPSRRSP